MWNETREVIPGRRILKRAAATAAAVAFLGGLLTGCVPEEEIVNVPTPKIEQQTVVLEREKSVPEHYFEVTGNGEIFADPDFAMITMKVSGTGPTAEEASAACQEETSKLIEEASHLYISSKDMQQRGVEIEAVNDETGKTPPSFAASDVVTLTVRQVGKVEQIVAALLDAGANELTGVSYSITDTSEAYRSALSAAIEDARNKAETMAETTNVKLGEVIGIVETAFDETKLIGVAFESSAIAVNAQVTVRYKIG